MKIGNVMLKHPFVLAPLAGITDAPFRRICKGKGASLVYSEMVSAKGLYYKDKNTNRLLQMYEDENPVAYQIFGADPQTIGFAAETLASRENAILDINMGCPVPKVVKNGEGSALLQNPKLIEQIISEAVKKAQKPVTAKIRIGWDDQSINAVEVAKAIEAAGASAVAVHGRTRQQYYSGKADWSMIEKVKSSVNIPVMGNGDVFSAEDGVRMLKETGCDFVMIARGALGNPWIFEQAVALWSGHEKPEEPSPEDKMDMLLVHLMDLVLEKGEYAAVREMRKHIGWYLKGISHSAEIKRSVNVMTKADELREIIEDFKYKREV